MQDSPERVARRHPSLSRLQIRLEREAEQARERFSRTHSNTALQRMKDAVTAALRAGSPSAKPSASERTSA